jgi:hypothetical protein
MIESFEKNPANGGMPHSARPADHHRDVGDRHVLAQSAHVAHVLVVVHGDDHGPCTQEQQRLEERVRHEVEHAARVRRDTERDGHVAELRERRVGDHALDVERHHAEDAEEQRAGGADHRDEAERRVSSARTAGSCARP